MLSFGVGWDGRPVFKSPGANKKENLHTVGTLLLKYSACLDPSVYQKRALITHNQNDKVLFSCSKDFFLIKQ